MSRDAGAKPAADPAARQGYETLLDDEVRAYVARVDSWYPPDAVDLPIAEQRAIYARMCLALHPGRPPAVEIADETFAVRDRTLAIRRYRHRRQAPRAAIVFYHGGGFVLGDLDSHDDVCADLCAATGYEVLSLDYRLAPEHRHPAAFCDARAAFDHAAARTALPLVLVGESAGGNLAAAVAWARRGAERPPAGQVLIYPGLGGPTDSRSYVEHADAPMLTRRDVEYYREMRTGCVDHSEDPTLWPLRARDFGGLPPTVIFTAQCDPLSSDGEAYRDRIAAAGGRARWLEEEGLVHSYLRARTNSARAAAAFARIIDATAALGRTEWPW